SSDLGPGAAPGDRVVLDGVLGGTIKDGDGLVVVRGERVAGHGVADAVTVEHDPEAPVLVDRVARDGSLPRIAEINALTLVAAGGIAAHDVGAGVADGDAADVPVGRVVRDRVAESATAEGDSPR